MNAIPPTPIQSSRSPRHSDLLRIAGAEHTLFDLLLIFIRYKWTLALATVAGTAIGVLVAMVLPRTYAYTTIIEVGRTEQGAAAMIESPDAVISKISNVYLPAIERQHGQQIGKPSFVLGLESKNPRGTKLVVMVSKGTEEQEDEHLSLHRQVAERVVVDHRRELQLLRTTFDLDLAEAGRAAAACKDKITSLAVRRTLEQEKYSLTTQQLRQLDEGVKQIEANRDSAGKFLNRQDQVLTLLMLDLQVAREREKQHDMQRDLAIGYAAEAERLAQEEADLHRSQQEQDGRITGIQARIAHIADSRVIGDPQRSQLPVGMGRVMITVIGIIMGVVSGIGIALLAQAFEHRRVHRETGKISV